jgi:hypothetical protein
LITATASALERPTRELHALTEAAKTLNAPLALPELLAAVLETLADVLEPAEAGADAVDASSGVFRAAAAFGYDLARLSTVGLRAGEAITGRSTTPGPQRSRPR